MMTLRNPVIQRIGWSMMPSAEQHEIERSLQ